MRMVTLARARKDGKKFLNVVETTVGGPGMLPRVIWQKLTNKLETAPKVAPGPFRTDVRVYETAPASGLRVTWFGHSAMLVEIDGVRLLVDPMWDERASPVRWAGPKRFFAATVPLQDLPVVDAVLISHDHYDHLGSETVRELAKLWPEVRWVTSLGVGAVLSGFGVRAERITELDWTGETTIDGQDGAQLRVTSLPARHFSGRYAWNRNETLWASFVLKGAKHNVYCGADSGMWDGFAAIGEQHGPFDLAMLEIGAFDELWRTIHLGPDGAVEAMRMLRAKVMMPVHWGLFDLGLHAWRQPMERVAELGPLMFQPEPGGAYGVCGGGGGEIGLVAVSWLNAGRRTQVSGARPGAPGFVLLPRRAPHPFR